MRSISVAGAPTTRAVSRQVAVTVATSLIIERACTGVSAKYSAPVKGLGVGLSRCAVLRKRIDDLGIAAALAVFRAQRRHGRQERNADCALPIETPRQQDLLAGDVDQPVPGRGDTGVVGQAKRDLLPRLHAVVVGFFRKLGDEEVAFAVDYR